MEYLFAFCFFLLLIVGVFYFFYFWLSDKPKEEKSELRSFLKTAMVILALISVVSFIVFCATAKPNQKSSQEKYDDMMAGYDWGEHSAYNKQNHSVEWVPWK